MKKEKHNQISPALKALYFKWVFFIFSLVFFDFYIPSFSNEVTDVSWKQEKEYLRIIVNLSNNSNYNIVNSLQEKNYFYINIYEITSSYKFQELPINDERLRSAKSFFYPEHKILRFVFYANASINYNITSVANPPRIVIDITNEGFSPTQIYRKKIVIIDPGHGGLSLGGRSLKKVRGTYIYEKSLTLKIAKKLKELFDSSSNIIAFMTREDDTFVSLKDRLLFSEKYKGDVFASIHCNDTRGYKITRASGVEFYYWNEKGSTDAAVAYLEELNNDKTLEVDLSSNNTKLHNILTNVLKDKLEAETAESTKFCGYLNNAFKDFDYFNLHNRGIKSARFKVLENYNMPAVLIETGFINNNSELDYLMSSDFQQKVAVAIYNAINTYFSMEDPKFQPTLVKTEPPKR